MNGPEKKTHDEHVAGESHDKGVQRMKHDEGSEPKPTSENDTDDAE